VFLTASPDGGEEKSLNSGDQEKEGGGWGKRRNVVLISLIYTTE
jgi:hypothetical protein